jgi:transcriptional regulator GlxA family with amidase domain
MGTFRSHLEKKKTANQASPDVIDDGSAGCTAPKKLAVNLDTLVPLIPEGKLRRVLRVMESETPRHVRDLAAGCRLSQSHLQHLFKRHTGIRLGHLLNQQRLERAADLLANSDMSIKEVACAVGYEHTSSFSRAFLRWFETAPSRYRKENGQDARAIGSDLSNAIR